MSRYLRPPPDHGSDIRLLDNPPRGSWSILVSCCWWRPRKRVVEGTQATCMRAISARSWARMRLADLDSNCDIKRSIHRGNYNVLIWLFHYDSMACVGVRDTCTTIWRNDTKHAVSSHKIGMPCTCERTRPSTVTLIGAIILRGRTKGKPLSATLIRVPGT